jgi:hypothetical protein
LTFESPSKLSKLGESAFCGCSSLQSVCIPSSVEELPESCFRNCPKLSELTFEAGSKLPNRRDPPPRKGSRRQQFW